MLLSLTNFNAQTNVSLGVAISTKVALEKALLSKENWCKNLPIFLHSSPDGPQMPELFVIWTHLDFPNHVSPKRLTSVLLWRSQSEACYLFCIFPLQILDLIPCSGILMDQKCEKELSFWTCLDIGTVFLLCCSYFVFPSRSQSIVFFT